MPRERGCIQGLSVIHHDERITFSFEMSGPTTCNLRSAVAGFLKLFGLILSFSTSHGFVQEFVVVTKWEHPVPTRGRGRGMAQRRQCSSHRPEVGRIPPLDRLLDHNLQQDPDTSDRVGAPKTETYESADGASKGLVSVLTSLVNGIVERMPAQRHRRYLTDPSNSPPSEWIETNSFDAGDGPTEPLRPHRDAPPRTAEELLQRIRNDYTVHNYLWTGNLDVACFDPECEFQDPTISFRGTDQFVRNVKNLRPVVDAVVTACQSDVLDISLNPVDGYVQTRWNMVGDLHRLPWRPRINVIGRTKFWYKSVPRQSSNKVGIDDDADENSAAPDTGVVVIRYDEEWEIPAYRALLQLVTPGGP